MTAMFLKALGMGVLLFVCYVVGEKVHLSCGIAAAYGLGLWCGRQP